MTSLDDLRATLDQHSTDLTGLAGHDDTAGRSAAIQGRVRAVRRHRRAGAAAGMAAALATVAGIALLPGGSEQSGPAPASTLLGITPPATLTSTGFTYGYERGVEGVDGTARLELAATDEPRLVSWATSGNDDRVMLGGTIDRGTTSYDEPDFTNWLLVPAGDPYTVRAQAESGEAALAVYALTDERPVGVTKGVTTFREDVAGLALLGAAIGDPGQSEVAYDAEATSQGIALKYFCSSAVRSAYLHVTMGGQDDALSGRTCNDKAPVDPAALGDGRFDTTPGEDVSTRLYVTDGRNGPALDDPTLTVGIATYALDEGEQVGSMDGFFAQVREEQGHTWRLAERTTVGEPGERLVSATAPSDRGAMLAAVGIRVRSGNLVTVDWAGNPGSSLIGGASASQSVSDVVESGGVVTLDFAGGPGRGGGMVGPADRVDIAFYERID